MVQLVSSWVTRERYRVRFPLCSENMENVGNEVSMVDKDDNKFDDGYSKMTGWLLYFLF